MKRNGLILTVLLLLTLSACGNRETESLRVEKDDLQAQVSALEKENAALRAELGQLQTEMRKVSESDRENNPIDRFYDTVETDGSTVSMNAVAYSCADAWEAEARNMAEQLKSQLPLAEDRDLVDAYIAAVEEQIERMNIMAIYQVSDLEMPQEERPASSGTLRGVLWAGNQANLWRDTFYQLYWVLPFSGNDKFLFDPEAVSLELP